MRIFYCLHNGNPYLQFSFERLECKENLSHLIVYRFPIMLRYLPDNLCCEIHLFHVRWGKLWHYKSSLKINQRFPKYFVPGTDPRGGEWDNRSPRKPKEVTLITMILYNSASKISKPVLNLFRQIPIVSLFVVLVASVVYCFVTAVLRSVLHLYCSSEAVNPLWD